MPCALENGGTLDDQSPRISIKYYDEARGFFGVAMIKHADGSFDGKKGIPFDYSGQIVVGVKTYNEYVSQELARVLNSKGKWGKVGHRYIEKFGRDRAYEEACKTVDKDYCYITDIMTHIVSESIKMFEGTSEANTFVIFHGGKKRHKSI